MGEAVMSDRLRQGVAVVTGAGGGLGRAMALELAGMGVTVAAIGRDLAALEALAAAAPAGKVHPVVLDVADLAAVPGVFARIAAEIGPVTLLVNNAAVFPKQEFMAQGPADFMAVVGVNLGGYAACAHAALAGMVLTGFGRILNVSTFADLNPIPASAAYAVSKGAGRILTRALIAELGDRLPDIVIGDWMPGMLATRMGIPDGIAPEQAARWGAALALWHDRSLTGAVFERDREVPPPRSLKRRVLDKVTGRKARIRQV